MEQLVREILDLDQHLGEAVRQYGMGAYLVLFAVVFAETGFVIFPFLPGDSLLFAAGTLASQGAFNLWGLMAVLILAAIAGDNVNYWTGRWVGPRLLAGRGFVLINKGHVAPAHAFFKRHGGKAVLLARFVPLVRSFMPFTAGLGAMDYRKFLLYDSAGAFLWVGVCVPAGFFFGKTEIVRDNFGLAIVVLGVLALVPAAVGLVRMLRTRAPDEPAASGATSVEPER